jgi:hypothetical protein
MKPSQSGWMLTLALIAGLAGGAAFQWLFTERPAFAEKTPLHEKVLKAEKFELVDEGGHEHASLAIGADGTPSMVLYDVDHSVRLVVELMAKGNARVFFSDQNGKIRHVLGTAEDGSPFIQFRDRERNVVWSAP